MYISRVQIDDENRQKICNLSHLGAYHDWVEQSFPEEMSQKLRLRHLWRIDALNQRRYLLVVSQNKPDLKELERYGVANTAMTKAYTPLLAQLQPEMVVNFRLVANPTRTNKDDGKVYPHITVAQQKKWLMQRAQNNGFELNEDDFDVVARSYQQLFHGSRRIKLSQVAFEGTLKITDVTAFKQMLLQGLGREKAYGMGMMTVIPLEVNNG